MKKYAVPLIIVLAILVQACYPGGPQYEEQLDVVQTSFDKTFPFNQAKTYLLIDSVVQLVDPNNPGNNIQVDSSLSPTLLQQVASSLNARGYTRLDSITPTRKPNMLVQISILATQNTQLVNNFSNYWGWYPGLSYYGGGFGSGFGYGYGPGYGYGGYGGYPYGGGYSVYSYNVGTVFVNITNPAAADTVNKTIPVVWSATFQGVASSSASDIDTRIVQGISQAFQQSPYLCNLPSCQ